MLSMFSLLIILFSSFTKSSRLVTSCSPIERSNELDFVLTFCINESEFSGPSPLQTIVVSQLVSPLSL
ncbi:hypothetical protein HanIR_Chr01g0014791 [Helianthus annuus]|nr:hypothetical protein HanIR_Chr01g0014791 [Helianthus annuus]